MKLEFSEFYIITQDAIKHLSQFWHKQERTSFQLIKIHSHPTASNGAVIIVTRFLNEISSIKVSRKGPSSYRRGWFYYIFTSCRTTRQTFLRNKKILHCTRLSSPHRKLAWSIRAEFATIRSLLLLRFRKRRCMSRVGPRARIYLGSDLLRNPRLHLLIVTKLERDVFLFISRTTDSAEWTIVNIERTPETTELFSK